MVYSTQLLRLSGLGLPSQLLLTQELTEVDTVLPYPSVNLSK
jgi:hypothetical protein